MSIILDEGHHLPVFSKVCFYCKHWNRDNIDKPGICRAFKIMIPEEIWVGDNKHTTPYDGDHGIQFEAIKK